MFRWNLAWLLIVPALTAFGFIVHATAPPPDKEYELVRTIVDVLAEVDKNYVRELSPDEKRKLVEEMINGGLDRLDEYSRYFNEEELRAFDTQTEGQFGGIGVTLGRDPRTQYLRVESPLPGTPAYDAGILAGDLILKVDDKPTDRLRTEEVRAIIKGKPGTKLKLTTAREGDTAPKDIELTRATIVIHAVKGLRRNAADPAQWDWLLDDGSKIALIRLVTFSEKSDKEVKDAVEKAESQGAKGIILDLRENPGGLLSQAATVADLFLNEGTIVSTADKRGDTNKAPRRTLSARADGTIFEPAANRPMVVLVNRNSASSAEILAAALQDHKRAIVVGERSYGKGSVQKIFPLNNNRAAVKLTTEVWLTPNGKNIHRWPDSKETDEWGVKPDAGGEVLLTPEQRLAYLQNLRDLDQVSGKPVAGVAPKAPTAFTDPVIAKAVELLKPKLK